MFDPLLAELQEEQRDAVEAASTAATASDVSSHFHFFHVGLRALHRTLHFFDIISKKAFKLLETIPIAASSIMLFNNLLKIAFSITGITQESKTTRVIKTFLALGTIGVTIAGIIAKKLLMPAVIVSASIEVFEHLWSLGTQIKSRFITGEWKKAKQYETQSLDAFHTKLHAKPELINAIRDKRNKVERIYSYEETEISRLDRNLSKTNSILTARKARFAETIHNTLIFSASLVGSVLLFMMPPIGGTILLATAAYSFLDKLHANPLKALAKFLFNPFAQKEHHASVEDIQKENTRRYKKNVPIPAVSGADNTLPARTKRKIAAPVYMANWKRQQSTNVSQLPAAIFHPVKVNTHINKKRMPPRAQSLTI